MEVSPSPAADCERKPANAGDKEPWDGEMGSPPTCGALPRHLKGNPLLPISPAILASAGANGSGSAFHVVLAGVIVRPVSADGRIGHKGGRTIQQKPGLHARSPALSLPLPLLILVILISLGEQVDRAIFLPPSSFRIPSSPSV